MVHLILIYISVLSKQKKHRLLEQRLTDTHKVLPKLLLKPLLEMKIQTDCLPQVYGTVEYVSQYIYNGIAPKTLDSMSCKL